MSNSSVSCFCLLALAHGTVLSLIHDLWVFAHISWKLLVWFFVPKWKVRLRRKEECICFCGGLGALHPKNTLSQILGLSFCEHLKYTFCLQTDMRSGFWLEKLEEIPPHPTPLQFKFPVSLFYLQFSGESASGDRLISHSSLQVKLSLFVCHAIRHRNLCVAMLLKVLFWF